MHMTTTLTLTNYLYTFNSFLCGFKFNNDVATDYNIAEIYPLFVSIVKI